MALVSLDGYRQRLPAPRRVALLRTTQALDLVAGRGLAEAGSEIIELAVGEQPDPEVDLLAAPFHAALPAARMAVDADLPLFLVAEDGTLPPGATLHAAPVSTYPVLSYRHGDSAAHVICRLRIRPAAGMIVYADTPQGSMQEHVGDEGLQVLSGAPVPASCGSGSLVHPRLGAVLLGAAEGGDPTLAVIPADFRLRLVSSGPLTVDADDTSFTVQAGAQLAVGPHDRRLRLVCPSTTPLRLPATGLLHLGRQLTSGG
jgi:hypothetical protein